MVTSRIKGIKDYVFEWEGRDRNGKSVQGQISVPFTFGTPKEEKKH